MIAYHALHHFQNRLPHPPTVVLTRLTNVVITKERREMNGTLFPISNWTQTQLHRIYEIYCSSAFVSQSGLIAAAAMERMLIITTFCCQTMMSISQCRHDFKIICCDRGTCQSAKVPESPIPDKWMSMLDFNHHETVCIQAGIQQKLNNLYDHIPPKLASVGQCPYWWKTEVKFQMDNIPFRNWGFWQFPCRLFPSNESWHKWFPWGILSLL